MGDFYFWVFSRKKQSSISKIKLVTCYNTIYSIAGTFVILLKVVNVEMIDSITYAKNHRKDFLATVIAKNIASSEKKTAIFMAGAPGSGKTEVAESTFELVPNLCNINADNFRSEFPTYTGNNSSQFQKGAAYLVDYVFSWLIDHRYSFLLDGTFAIKKSSLNIKRSLDHNYNVFIYYVYQDPVVAWDFTQIREKKEGRMVPKEQFINCVF